MQSLHEWNAHVAATLDPRPGARFAPLYTRENGTRTVALPWPERPAEVWLSYATGYPADVAACLAHDAPLALTGALVHLDGAMPKPHDAEALLGALGNAHLCVDAGFGMLPAITWLQAAAPASRAWHVHGDVVTSLVCMKSGEKTEELAWKGAAEASARAPEHVRFGCDAHVFERDGASPEVALGLVLGLAIDTVRALTAHGHRATDIAARLDFSLAVGTRVLDDIAKLRALRLLWSRMVQAAPDDLVFGARIMARDGAVARTSVAEHNLMRTALGSVAAHVGGADIRVVWASDALHGETGQDEGRRHAALVEPLLLDEAHLGRVMDPLGGSYAIEARTHAIALGGWDVFQSIVNEGGVLASFRGGTLRERIAGEGVGHA